MWLLLSLLLLVNMKKTIHAINYVYDVISKFVNYINGIYYAIYFYVNPVALIKNKSLQNGTIFSIPILFDTWHFFTEDNIKDYIYLNNSDYSDALPFRKKVSHLQFKDIDPNFLREKTGISKMAITYKIRNN